MAPAVSMMYLSSRVSMMTGIVLSSATMRSFLRVGLRRRLHGFGLTAERIERVIARAVSDVGYVNGTTGRIRDAVVGAYIDGLWWSHGESGVLDVEILVFIAMSTNVIPTLQVSRSCSP
jgi:hypothetical protein